MGKGGDTGAELRQRRSAEKDSGDGSAKSEREEVLIDGVYYDVTNFMRKHPGGRVLRYFSGTDASEAFHEFHMRSSRVEKYLKALPSRPAAPGDAAAKKDPLVVDFLKLRRDFEREGLFRPSPAHVAYRIVEIVAMHAVGLYLVLGAGWFYTGLVLLGLAQGRCGWFMHEGGHYSATGSIAVDKALQVFFYGFGCGMSAAFWRNQHNKHHATPQKLRYDVDLDTLPLVSFSEHVTRMRPRLVSKLWIKLQPVLFAPVTTLLVALGWQLYLHPRHALRTRHFDELACMALRMALWTWAFSPLGASTAAGAYVFYVWVGAMYIFLNFAVSHTHKPVVAPDEHKDWVRYAAEHTTNIHDSWWCNWWMGYLNFQIEHHLFPSMPQFRHPTIAPRVRALFEKHGVDYDCRSYLQAMAATFANLHNVGEDAWYG